MADTHDGVDPVALTRWLAAEAPRVVTGDGPVAVQRISGGHSNLTFRVVDAEGTPFALRRPPTGGVLATAHDMSREWRFLTALSGTGVPVAEPVAHCEDTAVIGAGFYLMSWVDGVVPGDRASGDPIPEPEREACGLDTADVLAALHAVDPGAVGLDDLRRPGRYLERQLRRWHRQAHSGAFTDLAAIDAAHEQLLARMPADPAEGPRIAHGDYRPGNLSYRDGRVAAVFDWELATLGEPLADLGWLVASWERPGDTRHTITSGPTAAPGWPERDGIAGRYAARSGRPVDDLPYWVAFAYWRCACIGTGVWTRYAQGNMGAGAESGATLERRRLGVLADAEAALAELAG
ncbi:putative phosphotransferase [Pseudonocardia sp. Ae168_Ps1]|uniref:phosphotransferase family protein n=1 Tax=unclassified Pseudonocardia TaxID=2619320 RepID=UPI0001FFE934|nr:MULTISPECIES: phosphotransferase family protein [unclassified Pseudonocardia]ALE72973.1 aminoglycoside phosphotransferase [Pseudonocardia sp. EC080625-04]ALL76302.1 aminoglycoside phosphotransferase [Pseudonocardia sp. EC080610-09]ALL83329.1 aminoglycoside phosphotransferase [Pseudonocardia sp. EC080619-01]OLL72909.1 putative phosphotransferase [Pseudonocardia sp. Ae150A_Ps1]OLL78884.1 putative phosphotransferase [Pseudonocardia sp. Ae168_Ps1]